MSVASTAEPRTTPQENPWRSLVVIAFGIMMVALDGTIVAVANPAIGTSLGATLAELQWVTHGYLLGLAVCLITAGKLADRLGHRRLYLVGVAGFTVSSVAIGLSSGTGMLIGFRVVQGAFGAALMPAALGMLRAAFPATLLNRALGVFSGLIGTSAAAGPIVGGLLVSSFDWQAAFFVNLPVGVLALTLGVRYLPPNRPTDDSSSFDLLGVALLTVCTFGIVLALVFAPEHGWTSTATVVPGLAGVVFGVAFVLWQLRAPHPLMPMSMFRSVPLSVGTVVMLIMALAMFGVMFFLTFYVQGVHGFTALEAGLQLLPLTALLAVGPPLASRLFDRFGLRWPILGGLLSAATAMFGMATLSADGGTGLLPLWLTLLGAGLGIVMVGATDAVIGNAPVSLAGVASGMQQTLLQLGGSLGTAILGAVVSGHVGGNLAGQLTAAGAPTPTPAQVAEWQTVVAQGGVVIPPGTAPATAQAITHASHLTFVNGMSLAFVVAGVALTLAAAISALLKRGEPTGEAVVHV
ncbi:DHA2 family efflux MFS transporter permease subunit [Allokutzneria albata]|uniref:Drug resistance transporter, EmrB/QacA subfamily n=1 Tax=Allokutzneria albata TaxID=211114 RepID=A0A1G9TU40_ALLAB|nr:DHA2 family efflux MFS transporter permease subunit [Allokutzneria albata]SDM51152.1 drug resistance transporter, EmrB/QacA subfamily [Allokutzneria albata]